jgi:hypothetical protein
MSPRPTIASFAERLAIRSPAWPKESVLGKRRATDDEQDATASMRVKVNSLQSTPSTPPVVFNSEDSEDEKLVEYSLIDRGSDDGSDTPLPTSISLDDPFTVASQPSHSSASDDSSSAPSPRRRRKRVFMESVEVLTLHEVIIRERKATTPEKNVLRRTRSTTLKCLSTVQAPHSSLKSSRKRSKRRLSNDPFSSSPIRALEEMDIAGSG